MAIPFVQSIDMNDFQLLNFVVHSAGSAPTNSSNLGGMLWWDSGNSIPKVYNDDDLAWRPLVQLVVATTTNGNVPTWDGTLGRLDNGYSVVTTVGNPGVDTAFVTDQGIREAITTAIAGGVTYKGAYNASTNTPDLETPGVTVITGDMYTVTVAGNFFTEPVDIGDVLIAESDTPTTLAEWTIVNRNIAETFLELTDTPSAFTASGGFMVMVDATPDALEFIDPSGYNLSNFSNDLVNFGTVDQIPFMNTGASDFEYTDSLRFIGSVLYASNVRVTALAAATTRYATIDADGDIGVTAEIPLVDLGNYVDGSIIIGGVADWTPLVAGTAGYVLTMGAARPEWASPGAPSAHNLLSTAHGDTTTDTVTRGSLIYGNATPLWDELVIGGATTFLYSDGTDVSWKDVDFADLGTTPTTFSGYGISDTMSNFDSAISNGNVAWATGAFHDTFSDYVASEHTDHSSIELTLTQTTDETSVTNSGSGQDITANRTWTIGLADNAVMPGTNDMTVPIGDTAAETGTDPGMMRYNSQTGRFRGNWAGSWLDFVYAGGVYHDGFSDFIGNEHINHTSVTITAGNGLSYSTGGTDISASATIDLDINSLSVETTIADGDFVPFWDITATATNKKITFANFVTQVEAGLSYAAIATGDVATGATPTITHNLNLTEFTDLTVQLWRQADNKLVVVEITAATKDTLTVNFGSAAINPALGTFRYVVTGIQE